MKAPTRRRVQMIALVVATSMFMAQLDGAVLATALPRIAAAFGVPPVRLSLAITIYLFTFVGLLPASSWIAERYGTRNIFLIAICTFTLGSLLCAMSSGYWPFIAARTLQGTGAALMTPVGRLILLRSTPRNELVAVMSLMTIPMLLAPTFGPALAGFIVTFLSWPWIFLLNIPPAALAIAATFRLIPNYRDETQRPLDAVGLVLLSGALLAFLVGIDQIEPGKGGLLAVTLLVVGTLIAIAAIRHLRNHPHPIISLAPLDNAAFHISTISGGALVRLPMRALTFLLPLLFQLVLGMTALLAGSMLLALNGGDLLLKPAARHCYGQFGFRNVLIVSALVATATTLACALFHPGIGLSVILGVLLAAGMARSLLFTGITSLAFVDLDEHEIGAANVIVSISQQVTSAIAVSISALILRLAALFHGGGAPALTDFQAAFIAMAAIGFLGAGFLLRLSPTAGAGARESRSPR